MNNNDRWDSAEDTKVGCLELFESNGGNGIILAPMCKGDGDEKCFTISNDKQCDHKVTTIKLDEVGDYLVFPSRFYHCGYYTITSNKTYYTAQLFCKATDCNARQNVTRKVNKNVIPGCVIDLRLTHLTQDIHNNWDTTYSVKLFPPAKAFDGDKIDATKNSIFHV
jgi:hypothetical protein